MHQISRKNLAQCSPILSPRAHKFFKSGNCPGNFNEDSCQNAFWDRLVTNMAADLKLQGQKTSGDPGLTVAVICVVFLV